ncbi:MAG: PhoPQ-activated pathogenicity-related family protein [Gammaproteobacteria bacterium]|nr:PhoPQ-activated pathogenicity-related family protein [Gammaproteobacteria bacterium]
MKNFFQLLKMFCCIFVIGFFCGEANAAEHCYSKMSEVLGCFLNYSDGVYKYEFIEENNDNPSLTKRTYLLSSQKWPIGNYQDIPATIWQHKLVFYIPRQISYPKVLLYVNGGRNRNIEWGEGWLSSKEQIDYASIAQANKAPVVELQTVPNQYLFFNGKPFKEDQILAYTYMRFMDNPLENAYLPGHLPMAKSVIKAMDAAQEILKQERAIDVTGFILSGASKRGWAVWLAALGDDRVEAMIPIVINILNVQKSLSYICQSYGGVCPLALRDYEQYGLMKEINRAEFVELMAIEDPYSYLQVGYDDKYKTRLAVPKYIINASGDDFFVPDSSRWYFKNLPGDNNYIRYLPNAMHYFRGNPISDSTGSLQAINAALSSYFYFILNKISLPKVSWVFSKDKIELTSSIRPNMIKLWVANNEIARDFRFITNYSRKHLLFRKILSKFSGSLCDNCYAEKTLPFNCDENTICRVHVPLPPFKKGWQASFVELHYNINDVEFVVTTEVNIVPDTLPKLGVNGHSDL